jgi:hypothetical protein
MTKIITRELLLDWKGVETEATKQENEEPIFRFISESNKNQNRVYHRLNLSMLMSF